MKKSSICIATLLVSCCYADYLPCDNLLVQISNFTSKTCRLVGHHTKGIFVSYTFVSGAIPPQQSSQFAVAPGVHNFYTSRTDILVTYDCGNNLISLRSTLDRCGREPTATIEDIADSLTASYETVRSRDTNEGISGYGVVHWFIDEKNNELSSDG